MKRESISTKAFAKGIAAGALAAASLGILHYPEYSINMKNSQHNFVPGTYTATAQGMDGPVGVTITVDAKTITDISVDVAGETPGIGAEIADEVQTQILTAQSSVIDGVAGATISSNAVKEALDAAIVKAEAGEVDEEVPETEQADAGEGITESAGEAEAATEGDAGSAPAAGGSAHYVPGTYEATAPGMESDVKVTVTVDESSITDVQVDVSGETAGLGADIGDTMVEAFMAAQSADVDDIASVSTTSGALRKAMADALAEASADGGAAEAEAVTEGDAGSAPAAGGSAHYVPGTYEATAPGMESDVKVTVTVDESSITDVQVDVSGETAGLGADIGDTMVDAFMAAQSADVDDIASVSTTSGALKQAMAKALEEASAGAGAEEAPAEEAAEEAVTEAAEEAVTEAAAEEASGAKYVPGTYEATAPGMESDVKVTVTVDESSITDVQVDVSGETAGLGADIGDVMVDAFMTAQSADVDDIASVSTTSGALKQAMAKALEEASAGAGAEEAPAEEAAEEAVTEAAEEAAEEAVTEAATEEAVAEAAAEEASGAKYVPGTYEATAPGMESDVKVTVTVDESSITDVQVDVSGETAGLGADIGDVMVDAFMAAQSADVDDIASVSTTSGALKQAMAKALEEASAGAGAEEAPAEEAVEEAVTEAAEEAVTEAAEEAPTQAAGAKYVPGTYEATAPGMESDVKVTVTVDESSITDVQVDVSGETAGLGADIGDVMVDAFMAAQSADVDDIASVSTTSGALKQAMAKALEEASAGAGAQEAPAEEAAEEAVTEAAEEAVTEAAEEAPTQAAGAKYVPGTYEATAPGMESDVKVTVTVDESSITDVQVDVSGETAGLGADIGDVMVDAFMAAQSADVDDIASVSTTSGALKQAMAKALEEASAGAGAQEAPAEEAEEAVTEAAAQETEEAVTEAAAEEAEEAVTEAAAEEAEEGVTEAAEEAPAQDAGAKYVPGTYEATAPGMESDVKVTVTVDESSITDVQVDVSGETAGLGADIGDVMVDAFMAAQSADVDDIASVSTTSGALKQAMAKALEEASADAGAGEAEAVTEGEDALEAATEGGDASGKYTPGTYEAKAQGMDSEVTVTVTVDENSITDVKVDVSGETPGLGTEIGDVMADAFMKAQSADVDDIATVSTTSGALRQAMAKALEEAAK